MLTDKKKTFGSVVIISSKSIDDLQDAPRIGLQEEWPALVDLPFSEEFENEGLFRLVHLPGSFLTIPFQLSSPCPVKTGAGVRI